MSQEPSSFKVLFLISLLFQLILYLIKLLHSVSLYPLAHTLTQSTSPNPANLNPYILIFLFLDNFVRENFIKLFKSLAF